MNAEETARYQTWLDEKWKPANPHACAVCKALDWGLANHLATLPAADGAGPFPLLVIYCKNCGNSLFINALISGVQQAKPT